MATTSGNRKNVENRWGHRRKSREPRNEREAFKGTPQFTFDNLYISPFTQKLTVDNDGRMGYTAIERNMNPTGIDVLDAYVQALHQGKMESGTFCARYGTKTHDLDGLLFFLTGMNTQTLRTRWTLRRADELLRFTDLDIVEIARLSGAGSRTNLYYIYEQELNTSPTDRRVALRQEGDLMRYKL